MTTEHPITPPPELIHEWQIKMEYIATRAAREALVTKVFQLGADQELEACCEWLIANDNPRWAVALQEGRRPKPPSLAEQAVQAWHAVETGTDDQTAMVVIRRALERLQELEGAQ